MPAVLVTGTNRGIGLEFVKQYSADDWQVLATARDPSSANELQKIAEASARRVKVLKLDVTDVRSVAQTVAEVGDTPIDVLINSAGVYGGPKQQLGSMDYEAWVNVLNINTMGPLRVTEAFIENVARSQRKLVVALTSGMGSLADNTSGGYIAYRSSKAALNMVMRTLAIDLAPRGITSIVINPGWVRTRMGGPGARMTPEQSVRAMRKVFERAGPAQSGKFVNHDGREYLW
jgi:NAD(P)-dependent dehydrogenase (short-subunit alcohol dehydrogenase family)